MSPSLETNSEAASCTPADLTLLRRVRHGEVYRSGLGHLLIDEERAVARSRQQRRG